MKPRVVHHYACTFSMTDYQHQKFLGHKRLNTTLTYARGHDQTVAENYFAAMASVEKRLDLLGKEEEKP